jgi:uncharacterized protein YecE (DUF72 family)
VRGVNRLILCGDVVATDAYCARLLAEHDGTFSPEMIAGQLKHAAALGLGTADLDAVRLHGHEQTYRSAYSGQQLSSWAERICRWQAEGRDVHVYFDNTSEGAALTDAERLSELLANG